VPQPGLLGVSGAVGAIIDDKHGEAVVLDPGRISKRRVLPSSRYARLGGLSESWIDIRGRRSLASIRMQPVV